jgi:hypothetical protein
MWLRLPAIPISGDVIHVIVTVMVVINHGFCTLGSCDVKVE